MKSDYARTKLQHLHLNFYNRHMSIYISNVPYSVYLNRINSSPGEDQSTPRSSTYAPGLSTPSYILRSLHCTRPPSHHPSNLTPASPYSIYFRRHQQPYGTSPFSSCPNHLNSPIHSTRQLPFYSSSSTHLITPNSK